MKLKFKKALEQLGSIALYAVLLIACVALYPFVHTRVEEFLKAAIGALGG